MNGLTIEVDVAEILSGEKDPAGAIIDRAARYVAKSVRDEMRKDIQEAVDKVVRRQVEELAEVEVRRILNSGIQETNMYGEPKGRCRTMREHLVDTVGKVLHSSVNSRGERSTYSREGDKTWLQWIAEKESAEIIQADLKNELDSAKMALRTMLNGRIDALLRRAVCEVLNLPKDIADAPLAVTRQIAKG